MLLPVRVTRTAATVALGAACFGACAQGSPRPIGTTLAVITVSGGGSCGDGVVDVGEECDGGACCNIDCTRAPNCGEKPCNSGGGMSCGCSKSGVKDGVPCHCSDVKLFAKVVSRLDQPLVPGDGLPAAWSYKNLMGTAAGNAACNDVGGDHVCRYEEIVQADAHGELAGIPHDLTFWMPRADPVADPLQAGVNCGSDADCGLGDKCDLMSHTCTWAPGAFGTCHAWVSAEADAAGEWFCPLPDPQASGGVALGSLSYHFASDASATGKLTLCLDETTPGCAGPCYARKRAILCCYAKCT